MKINKFTTILAFGMLLLLTSCNKLFDTTSSSQFNKSFVFSDPDDAKKAVLGVYSMFAADPYTSRMSCVFMQNTDVEANSVGAAPDGTRRDVWSLQGGLLPSFSDVKTCWDNNYQAIDRANQCIDGIKSSSMANNIDMKMLLGECYCLRAYRYFLLCNFWGDVPYYRAAVNYDSQLDLPKTDKNIIYSGMIQDLVDCESNMYFSDGFSDGIERMNRDFALGMITRLALFRAGYGMTKDGTMKRADDYLNVASNDSLAVTYTALDGTKKVARTYKDYYQLAKDYAQKLISLKNRTLGDYATVFMNENQWIKPQNGDILYEVAFGNGSNAGKGDVGWCIGVTVSASSYGSGGSYVCYSPTYYFSFDPKDKRRDVCIARLNYSSDTKQNVNAITGLTPGKWNRLKLPSSPGSSSSKSTGINWPLMRYADVLLMLAEADNEINNGPTDLAKKMLTLVRTRAFDASQLGTKVTHYVDSVANKGHDGFFNAIVDERAWELGGECVRKFDLVRWNIYGKKILQVKNTLDYIGQATNGVNLTDPNVAKYTAYAKKIYYYTTNSGQTVNFLNDYYEPSAADLLNWVKLYGTISTTTWGTALYKSVTTGGVKVWSSADYTTRTWRGYTDATGVSAVPYLLPVAAATVANSKYLNNNGYGLVSQ
jgi:Capsule polysaccharide export protein